MRGWTLTLLLALATLVAFSEAKLQSLCQEPGCECLDDADGLKEVQCQCVHNQVRNTYQRDKENGLKASFKNCWSIVCRLYILVIKEVRGFSNHLASFPNLWKSMISGGSYRFWAEQPQLAISTRQHRIPSAKRMPSCGDICQVLKNYRNIYLIMFLKKLTKRKHDFNYISKLRSKQSFR